MNLRDRYREHIDSHGLVQPHNDTSWNGVRFTADMLQAACVYMYDWSDDDLSFTKECYAALKRCERKPGLLNRWPGNNNDWQSFDDTIAYIAVSGEFARDWLNYGRNPEAAIMSSIGIPIKIPFTYNNVDPTEWTLQSWLGRNQALIAHAQLRGGEEPSVLRQLIWAASVFGGIAREGQDERMLNWHLLRTADDPSTWKPLFYRNLCSDFAADVRRRWGSDGLGGCLRDYFGFWHPTAELLKGCFL